MAWMSFARPHIPLTPSEPYASMYDPRSIHLPPFGDAESPVWRELREAQGNGTFDEPELRRKVAAYLGCASQLDAAIGMVLRELEERAELDNTIIVYSADHGDYAGEHGLHQKTHGIRARSICAIPLLIRFPSRVTAGRTCEEIAEAVDVFPTLCELSGGEAPLSVQGRSLLPLLGDDPRPVREDALTENMYRKSIATKRFRYVACAENEEDELYDQIDDPWEQRNLIHGSEHRGIIRDMQKRLHARLVSARRPITAFRGMWIGHRYDESGLLDPTSLGDLRPYD